jgi:hypoxanthine-DNA glycosylase
MPPADRRRGTSLRGFAPVLDAGVEAVVLGSFPSVASLAAGQYYAHPRNAFWTVMGEVVGEPLAPLAYPQRLQRLLAHRIGLWDVMAACERPGSLDADIRNPVLNDLAGLRQRAPRLHAIAFNGAAAGRLLAAVRSAGWHAAVLPSTSPAHAARSVTDKALAWRQFFAPVLQARPLHA